MKSGIILFAVLLAPGLAGAETIQEERLQLCMVQKLKSAPESTTIAQLKEACADQPAPSLAVERMELEQATYDNRYAIAPHKPNYFLFAAHNAQTPGGPPFDKVNDGKGQMEKTEAEFQVSLKFPVIRGDGWSWMGAYTNRSFWQIYNSGWSRPFRETNHEPETWLQVPLSTSIPGTGMTLRAATIGFVHQSNGQTGDWSRSWNRITSSLIADSGNFALALRPWWRIPEHAASDDNPDINHYLGNFDLTGSWRFMDRQRLSFTLRNNLETAHNRGGYELGYSFPLFNTDHLRAYVQGFNGYGKSLIDYNHKQTSIGAGLEVVDW